MAQLNLSGGYGKDKYVILDDSDFVSISRYKWYLTRSGYAARHKKIGYKKYRTVYLHKEIFCIFDSNFQVDHINLNRLDNRRINLRICTRSQNSYNSPMRLKNKTGYKGVELHQGKFKARISFHKKTHYIGIFNNPKDAAIAYNERARELFGNFARLNQI